MKNYLKKLIFSHSTSTVKNTHCTNTSIDLKTLTGVIKNGIPTAEHILIKERTIDQLNNGVPPLTVKDNIKALKEGLRFFQLSGYQQFGHNNRDIEYNGCVQVDIDFKEKDGDKKAQLIKAQLSELPYVIFVGISPSGVGVKALVHTTNMVKSNHKDVVIQVNDKINSVLNIDKKYFDNIGASTPCFVFHDSDLYTNFKASKFLYKESLRIIPNKDIKRSKDITANSNVVLSKRVTNKFLHKAYMNSIHIKGMRVGTEFLQIYIGSCINFGIKADVALQYLYDKGHKLDVSNAKVTKIHKMYELYADQFGIVKVNYHIPNIVATKPENNFELTGDDTVSSLNLDLSVNTLLKSPTNTGKTFFVCETLKYKRIIVVPKQNTVEQLAKDYGGTPFYEHNKELAGNDNLIITTFNSLGNLCNKINASEYVLFIDEAHHFTTSTSDSYLLNTMTQVLGLLQTFKNYHLMTATPLYNYSPLISGLNIIEVKKDKDVEKNVYILNYKNRTKTIKEVCTALAKKGEQFAVLFNNTKNNGQLGKILSSLSHLNVVAVNSTTKGDLSYTQITIDGDMTGVDGIVNTTIFGDSNNVDKHTDNMTVLVVGKFHPVEMEQMTSRFRNCKRLDLVLLKSVKHVDGICNFNATEASADLLDIVTLQKTIVERCNNSYMGESIIKLLNLHSCGMYKFNDDSIVPNELGMSNIIFNAEKSAVNIDSDFMMEYLALFQFKFKRSYNINAELSKEEIVTIKNYIDKHKKIELDKTNTILEDIKTVTKEENDEILNTHKYETKLEQDLRFKASFIATYTDNMTEAVDKLMDVGTSTYKFNNFKKSVLIQKVKTDSRFTDDSNNPTLLMVNDMYDTFKNDNNYSTEFIRNNVNEILFKHFKTKPLSKIATTKLLFNFVGAKRSKLRTKNGDRIDGYKILTHNPTELNINTNKLRSKTSEPRLPKGFFEEFMKMMQPTN